jgi:hypothetical protein
MNTGSVSSSLSTGGAGTFFERDVGAYWLAQLLLRAIPPILIDTQVIEVCFQTEHLGWKTSLVEDASCRDHLLRLGHHI